jgi:hypothetical protein
MRQRSRIRSNTILSWERTHDCCSSADSHIEGRRAKEAVETANSAYDDVVSAAEDYADVQISEIESARETFEDTIDEIPDSATLAEADLARQNAYETLFGVLRSTLDTQCTA